MKVLDITERGEITNFSAGLSERAEHISLHLAQDPIVTVRAYRDTFNVTVLFWEKCFGRVQRLLSCKTKFETFFRNSSPLSLFRARTSKTFPVSPLLSLA